MKTLSFLAVLFLLSLTSMAQQPGRIVDTIKGKVIDATTSEPVSYTNIGLEGTYFGTASDAEGNFELKIPEEMVSKDIFFSAVGFKNKQFPVKSLFDKEFNIIKIESQSYGIDDVDIAAQNMVLIRILRMASENIPYNFIRGPYNLEATYKNDRTIDNNSTKRTSEVLIYDQNGYSNPSKKDAYQSLKYSLITKESDDVLRFSEGATNLDELLEMDWARSATSVLNPAITAGFNLKMEDEPSVNGQDFWVISFKQEQPSLAGSGDYYASAFEGEITINKEDYSVLKIIGKVESSKNNRQGKSLAVGTSNTNVNRNVSYDFLVEYKSLKPLKIELNKTYSYNGSKISENSLLEINQVKTTNLTQLDSRQYFIGE